VRDEWFKGLVTARSIADLVRLWRESGAAARLIPELGDASTAVLARAEAIGAGQRDPVLLTALLVSDPAAVLRRLRASGAEIDRAAALTAGPQAPSGPEDAAVRRWLATVGKAADDLMALWALRHGAPPSWAAIVQRIRERGDPLTRGDLALGGSDLQALGLAGPRIGETLALLLDRVLEDPSRNTRDTLLSIARALR
jgi:hypothetical protein